MARPTMEISQETISILKNFQSINQSIILTPGNVVRTMNTTNSVFAMAQVSDTFPLTAPIYDLQKFLSILSLSKDPSVIEFGDIEKDERNMIISQGNSKIKYAYCDPSLIKAPPVDKKIKVSSVDVSFDLNQDAWQQVSSAMSILGFSEFAFVGEEGVLSIQALSTKDASSDTFTTELGKTDLTFKAILDSDKMKLIPGDYSVDISSKGLSHFKGPTAEYWIAISTSSEFQ